MEIYRFFCRKKKQTHLICIAYRFETSPLLLWDVLCEQHSTEKEIAIISNENPIQHKSYIPPITYGNNWQKPLLSRGRCGYRYKSVAVEYFHHFGFCSVRFSDFQYALLGFPVTKKQLFLNFFNKKSH